MTVAIEEMEPSEEKNKRWKKRKKKEKKRKGKEKRGREIRKRQECGSSKGKRKWRGMDRRGEREEGQGDEQCLEDEF